MPNAAVDVGTGAAVLFGTSGILVNFTSLDLGEQVLDVVDTTHLLTTGFKTLMGADLINPGEWTFEFQWDNEAGPVPLAVAEQVTITFPQSASNATSAATYVASGVLKNIKYPTLGLEELQMGSLVFAPDGNTGPTYTDGV